MYFIYIDDSGNQNFAILSALAVPTDNWKDIFNKIKCFRHKLKVDEGIFTSRELHACDFVARRGKIANKIIPKARRCYIYKETLKFINSQLSGIKLFNSISPINKKSRLFERLLNRINRTMQAWQSKAIIFCDEGREKDFTKISRRLSIFNPIPSRFGRAWLNSGNMSKNIPTDRILEDPIFKKSHRSYFIQFADFCAYSFFQDQYLTEKHKKYFIHTSFSLLKDILVREASMSDNRGIIRVE